VKKYTIQVQTKSDGYWHDVESSDSMLLALHAAADAMNDWNVIHCQIKHIHVDGILDYTTTDLSNLLRDRQ